MLTSLIKRYPLLRGMLDFAFPPLCAGCREFCENPYALCEKCLETIDWLQKPTYLFPVASTTDIDEPAPSPLPVFAAGDYSGPLRETVLQVKFHHVTAPLELLAERLFEKLGADITKLHPTHLLPIPLHPSREYTRGFNQARLLAECLAPLFELPIEDHLLFRTGKRRPQSRLSETRRAANIRGVFEVVVLPTPAPSSARFVLVDEVVTSGHTILEAERTLRAAGYSVVAVAAVARTL